jgi:hypothetical protein
MLSKRFPLLLLISRFVDPHEDAKPGETNRQSSSSIRKPCLLIRTTGRHLF